MSKLLAVIVFSVTILVAGVPHGLAQTLSSPETDTELQLPPSHQADSRSLTIRKLQGAGRRDGAAGTRRYA